MGLVRTISAFSVSPYTFRSHTTPIWMQPGETSAVFCFLYVMKSESSSLLVRSAANDLVSAALTRGRWPISAQNASTDYWHKMAHVNLLGQYGPSS